MVGNSPNGGFIIHHNSISSLGVEVNYKQDLERVLIDLKESVLGNFNESFSMGDGILRYQGRLCVSDVEHLRNRF